ncbi:hypothetical protein [Cellulomonas sp. Marseille-Q8402]
MAEVARLIDFHRRLRLLVLDGVERIEVAARMRVGHVLGRGVHLPPRDAGVVIGLRRGFRQAPGPETVVCLPS